MAWLFRVDFQGGSGWEDITSLVELSSITRTKTLHNNLKPTIDNMTFKVNKNAALFNSFLGNSVDTLVNVQLDGADYFTGTVRVNFSTTVGETLGKMKIECVGYGEKLEQKVSTSFAYVGYKVSDSTTKTASMIHQLLVLAGFDVDDDIDIPTIDKTIDYFVNIGGTDSKTYSEVITQLLYEFGYVWYFDESGVFKVYDLFPTTVTATGAFNNSNMRGSLSIARKDMKVEGVSVTWNEHYTTSGAEIIFSDTTGGDDTNKCNITLEADGYYPEGVDAANVYSEFNYNDYEVIYASGVTLDEDSGSNITSSITNYFKQALVTFHNTGGTSQDITKFDIKGTVTYKGDEQATKCYLVSGTENIEEITTEYITTSTDADKFTIGLARWYRYSDFTYKLSSTTDYDIGTIVTITEDTLGFSTTAVITKVVDADPVFETKIYTLEGIEAYSAETTSTEGYKRPPAPAAPISTEGVLSRPTYTEIVSGFTAGGGVVIPTVPTISICKGVFRGIVLTWDHQANLTNFDRYEIQVSADESDWYSLEFDGTDWKDTLDDQTAWDVEFITHTNIPLTGDADDPSGQTLYYRVRRVTKASVYSSWSAAVSATTTTVKAGDLAENSIYANNIIAAEVNALLLKASVLWTAYAGTGTYDNKQAGDLTYKFEDMLFSAQEYTNDEWSDANAIKIGGLDSGNNLLSRVACRALQNPLADAPSGEFIPSPLCRVVDCESADLSDQFGHTPDVLGNAQRTLAWSKFGTYSMNSSSGGTLVYYNDLLEAAGECSLCFWYRNNATDATTAVGPAQFTYTVDSNNGYDFIITMFRDYTDPSGATNYVRVLASIKEGGVTQQALASMTVPYNEMVNADIFLGVSMDTVNKTVYLVVNGGLASATWASNTVSGSSSTNEIKLVLDTTSYIDDLAIIATESSAPDLLLQHYQHNVPWNTDCSAKDLALIAADGGYIDLLSPTKYYAPVSGEESVGTPVYFTDDTTRRITGSITSQGAWMGPADFSSYIPDNAKGIIVQFDVTYSGSSGGLLCWTNDNTESVSTALNLGRGALMTGGTRWTTKEFVKADDGNFYYGSYSSAWAISALQMCLLGYYI